MYQTFNKRRFKPDLPLDTPKVSRKNVILNYNLLTMMSTDTDGAEPILTPVFGKVKSEED